MPKHVYFDANVFFDVFQANDETLYGELKTLVAAHAVELVVSDVNLAEAYGGNQRPGFEAALDRVLSLGPRRLLLTGLAAREVVDEYGNPRRIRATSPPGKLLSWSDFLPFITSEEERAAASPDLAIPTAKALAELYQIGSVRQRLKQYWQPELDDARESFRVMIEAVKTVRNVFWKVLAATLRLNFKQTQDLMERLWSNPDLAPAFRLEIELTVAKLAQNSSVWSTNDFFDNIHAGALPRVDLFVSRDDRFLKKLKRYDDQVRMPRAASPYMSRICTSWSDFTARV